MTTTEGPLVKTQKHLPVSAEGMIIAITVYDRRDYVIRAIESALAQTQPVKVLVVEDCSPDRGMQAFIEKHFANRIQYHRNAIRHGLFGNWNVCLELCTTPWLSILHDDDYLGAEFTGAMIDLARQAPDCGIYFSSITHVDYSGRQLPLSSTDFSSAYRKLDPRSLAQVNDVLFPGQLFRADLARRLGGFREASQFCGDWEMWFKLAHYFGAAQTSRPVAYCRSHEGDERGTNKVVRNGRKHALDFVQAKRNLAILRSTCPDEVFDRKQIMQRLPLPIRYLLPYAATMSPRLLRYNTSLLLLSRSPHWRYRAFQIAVCILGPQLVRVLSRLLNILRRINAWSPLSSIAATSFRLCV
jgi:glycosyltransferase involved in cell wall biosynthesis